MEPLGIARGEARCAGEAGLLTSAICIGGNSDYQLPCEDAGQGKEIGSLPGAKTAEAVANDPLQVMAKL